MKALSGAATSRVRAMAAPEGRHFVVTGSGKCGTHYLQAVLSDLGRALLFVERWNRHLDRTPTERSHLRYLRRRVEEISGDPEVLDAVVGFLTGERAGVTACMSALRRVSPETGRSSTRAALTWAD